MKPRRVVPTILSSHDIVISGSLAEALLEAKRAAAECARRESNA
jgi:hypothetical protein